MVDMLYVMNKTAISAFVGTFIGSTLGVLLGAAIISNDPGLFVGDESNAKRKTLYLSEIFDNICMYIIGVKVRLTKNRFIM
jgi:hypothetical protein